ncbi:TMV resistance protein [Nymphaea thermarum]|nr:TMV resistance protein [Nymphaea thermarum]
MSIELGNAIIKNGEAAIGIEKICDGMDFSTDSGVDELRPTIVGPVVHCLRPKPNSDQVSVLPSLFSLSLFWGDLVSGMTTLTSIQGHGREGVSPLPESWPSSPSSSSSSSPTLGSDGEFEFDVFLSFRLGDGSSKAFTQDLCEALKAHDLGTCFFVDKESREEFGSVEQVLGAMERSGIFIPIFSKGYADCRVCLMEVARMVELKRLLLPVFYDVEPREVRNQRGSYESAFRKHEESEDLDSKTVKKWRDALKETGEIKGYDIQNEAYGYTSLSLSLCFALFLFLKEHKLVQFIVKRVVDERSKVSLDVASTEAFAAITQLRLLHVNAVDFEGHFHNFPTKLKWLQWHGCMLDSLPDDLLLKELVVLDLFDSSITNVWSGNSSGTMTNKNRKITLQVFDKLKVLDLTRCNHLKVTPNFDSVPRLEKLVLDDCCALIQVHESISHLKHLVYWSMKRCQCLKKLPDDIFRLNKLENFALEGCGYINTLPEELGEMKSLKELNLRGIMVQSIPDTVGLLSSLQALDLRDCLALSALPNSIGTANNLRVLYLDSSGIQELPDSIGCLENLEELKATQCYTLNSLPSSLGNARNLKRLCLDGTNIRYLPESIGLLENLEVLQASYCDRLRSLPASIIQLNNLRSLDIRGTEVSELPREIWRLDDLKISADFYKLRRRARKEITEIVACKRLIVPVFYDVEPNVVRHQTGSFESSFRRHENNRNLDQGEVKKWREALKEVGEISGYNLRTDTNWIHDVQQGINLIKQRIGRKRILLILDDIDNEEQFGALTGSVDWLCRGSRVIVTTRDKDVLIASKVNEHYKLALLDRIQSLQLFTYHAFRNRRITEECAELSKEIVSAAGGLPLVVEVYGKLFSDLAPHKWGIMVKKLNKCQTKKIHDKLKISFEKLDDCEKQIFLDIACFFIGYDTEYATHMWHECEFYPELALDVLVERSLVKINSSNKFEMHDQIRDMGRQIVMHEYKGELRKRSRLWEATTILEALEYPQGIWKTQAISLHTSKSSNAVLNTKAFRTMSQLRLLHVSNVTFGSEHPHLPKSLKWLQWKDCPFKVLPQDFHLEKVVVLDLSRSRISCLLHEGAGPGVQVFDRLKVLDLTCCQHLVTTPDFSNLRNAEKLIFDGCRMLVEVHQSIGSLKSLVCLSMRHCRKLKKLPDNICNLNSLQRLDLFYCIGISALPDLLGYLKSLKHLNLSFTRITTLPESMSKLKKLNQLDFQWCRSIKHLPEWIGGLKSLENLNILGTKIEKVPESIEGLINLQSISAGFCKSLANLPYSFGNLKNLRYLDLQSTNMQELPDSIGLLGNLEKLSLSGCSNLKVLPSSVGLLKNLKELEAGEDSNSGRIGGVTELPETIGSLTNLRRLILQTCVCLYSLPSSLTSLSQLETLNVEGCKELQHFPQLPFSLVKLSANGCAALKSISGVLNLKNLRDLSLGGCHELVDASALESLTCLENLELCHCNKLQSLPQLSGSLIDLDLSSCHSVEKVSADIPGQYRLKGSVELNFEGISESPPLPLLMQTPHMTYSPASAAPGLTLFASNLKSLRILNLSKCKMLSCLHMLENLNCLESLKINECSRLKFVPRLPSSLLMLSADGCSALEFLCDVSNAKALRQLQLCDCKKLIDICGLESLNRLEELELLGCSHLSDGLRERIEEENFERLFKFSIAGQLDPSNCSSKQMRFLHPKRFEWKKLNLALYQHLLGIMLETTINVEVKIDEILVFKIAQKFILSKEIHIFHLDIDPQEHIRGSYTMVYVSTTHGFLRRGEMTFHCDGFYTDCKPDNHRAASLGIELEFQADPVGYLCEEDM